MGRRVHHVPGIQRDAPSGHARGAAHLLRVRLVPAGLAARDRSFRDDDDRKLRLLVASTIPAAVVGLVFNDLIEDTFRQIGFVVVALVVGGVILLVADRVGATSRRIEDVTFPIAIGIGPPRHGAAPGSVGRDLDRCGRPVGMDRDSRGRPAFLMATLIRRGRVVRGTQAAGRRRRRGRGDRPRRGHGGGPPVRARRDPLHARYLDGSRSISSSGTASRWQQSCSSPGWHAEPWRS